MTSQNDQRIRSSLINALLDQGDPHRQPLDAGLSGERRVAGLWIAWKRASLGLSSAELATQVGLDEHSLQLLELGVAGRDLASDNQWERCCLALADDEHTFDRVAASVAIALGEPGLGRGIVIEQARRDLHELVAESYAENAGVWVEDMATSPPVTSETGLLLRNSIFANLQGEHLSLVSSLLTVEEFEPGEIIFHQGTKGFTLYIIVEGEVQISVATRTGQSVPIERAGRGRFFGEFALLDGQERSATVTAITSTRTLRLSKSGFDKLSASRPEIYRHVAVELARRLRATNAYLEFLRDETPARRLIGDLLHLVVREDLAQIPRSVLEHIDDDLTTLQELGVLEITPTQLRLNLQEPEPLS